MSNDDKKTVSEEEKEESDSGVLLYYKYSSVPDLNGLLSFYESNCKFLHLRGRVRLSPHGVNVTVGGKLSSLKEHIAAVRLNSLFEGTDFKLASCHQPLDPKVAQECGFTTLSIRVVEELVTFSSCGMLNLPDISNAGKHLSAAEFHSFLQKAGKQLDEDNQIEKKELVLLDARNLYETRIGKFQSSSMETLDPEIRQYSDLPSWIDKNAEKLKDKNVLMYCTGGIRCEMASAYIRSKGDGFENVFQLYGGIQRYLEHFPNGGFFKGKNFVFDHRISVGSSDEKIIGSCLLCGSCFDDYSSRCRCAHCRMLVLVCDKCRVEGDVYVCELCQRHGKDLGSIQCIKDENFKLISPHADLTAVSSDSEVLHSVVKHTAGNSTRGKLRILCLHGFRQNASSFKGRSASLSKKLKNIAELVFVDAPHELPFIYQPSGVTKTHDTGESTVPLPPDNCRRKFAWLVSSDFHKTSETDWKVSESPFDPFQYQQQTQGYDASIAYLKRIVKEEGPFDGILGFSQGAAMAALVCSSHERLMGEFEFRFAVLCSGFAPPGRLLEDKAGWIKCPSLHIYGSRPGKDRQIEMQASRYLASLFDQGCEVVVEHDCGHIIPTRPPFIDEIKGFLKSFI